MALYKLSPAAEQDLIEIYLRGLSEWGANKSDQYQEQLISAFNLLAQNPEMGRIVKIRPNLHRHEFLPYIIFYSKENYGVRIARVLYKNRLIERHL